MGNWCRLPGFGMSGCRRLGLWSAGRGGYTGIDYGRGVVAIIYRGMEGGLVDADLASENGHWGKAGEI